MKPRKRIYYTPEQKAIIWDRYKQGDSLHEIARMFDRYHSSIMPTIYQTGGFRPPVRKRHRLSLSLDEREVKWSHNWFRPVIVRQGKLNTSEISEW